MERGQAERGALVGRERELTELLDALGESLDGRGAAFMVTGEPGIGKTTLVAALAAHAEAAGAACLWGACWDGGGAPAFWPWIQVVRGLARRRDAAKLREDLGPAAGHVARLVPELDGLLGGVPDPPPADPEEARFRLLDGVTSLLTGAARDTPLVVVLDDLHVADQPSLALLEFLLPALRDSPLLVVGTYRDADVRERSDLAAVLGAISRSGRRLPLRGLEADALARLVANRAPGAPAALATALHARTQGNPFFVDELLRLIAAEGRLGDPRAAAEVPLPEGVREAIRRRLDPLAPATIDILRVASVIGGVFRLVTVAGAAGVTRTEALGRLDDAIEAGIIEDVPGAPGEFCFAHALIRETLYESLSTGRRVALHGAVATTLEELHGEGGGVWADELAHHFVQAAPAGDAEKAVRYATEAGHRAIALFAYPEAVAAYRGALTALELLPPDDRTRFLLLHLLGECQVRAGDILEGRRTLREAAGVARAAGKPRRFARAALGGGAWGISPGDVNTELVSLLEEAIRWMDAAGDEHRPRPPAPPPAPSAGLRAQLRSRLALSLYWSAADAARRDALVAEAERLADAFAADPRTDARHAADTRAYVLCQGFVATWNFDRSPAGIGRMREVIDLCRDTGDTEIELRARSILISLLLEANEGVAAALEIASFARLAHKLAQPRAQFYVPQHAAIHAMMEGRFADAEAAAARGTELGARVPGSVGLQLGVAQMYVIRLAQGRLGEIEPAVRQFADSVPGMPVWRCGLARAQADAGHRDAARAELRRFAPHGLDAIPFDNVWPTAMALLADTAAVLGDGEAAAALRTRLEPYAGRNVVSPEAAFLGPVDRYLARCALAMGDLDGVRAHATAARAQARTLNAEATLVLADADEALGLHRLGGASARAEAMRLAADAAGRAERFGMPGTASALEEVLGAPPPGGRAAAPLPAPAGPSPENPAPPPEPAAETAVLERTGEIWRVGFKGHVGLLKDAKGLRHLAVLLAAPDTDHHALDLIAAAEGEVVVSGEPGPALDARARRAYRARIAELREEADEAEAFNDPERLARAREELEFLARELAGATGLGGRDRATGSSAERARVNVTRALRAAIERIAGVDPALGRHLETSVRTGMHCAYRPDPEARVRWRIVAGG